MKRKRYKVGEDPADSVQEQADFWQSPLTIHTQSPRSSRAMTAKQDGSKKVDLDAGSQREMKKSSSLTATEHFQVFNCDHPGCSVIMFFDEELNMSTIGECDHE